MIGLDSIPRPAEGFCVRTIDEQTIFLAESGDEVHSTEEVGTFVWKALDGARSVAEIADLVCQEFDVEPSVAQADLVQFISELEAKGLVRVGPEVT